MRQTQIYDLDMVWNLAKWPVFSAWCEVRLEKSLGTQVEFNGHFISEIFIFINIILVERFIYCWQIKWNYYKVTMLRVVAYKNLYEQMFNKCLGSLKGSHGIVRKHMTQAISWSELVTGIKVPKLVYNIQLI